jgi:hypothetical protein
MRWLAIVGVLAACGGPSRDPVVAEPTVTLDPTADVNGVVASAKGRILACYQRGLTQEEDLAGKLVIAFTIDTEGRVAGAMVDEASNLDSPDVEDCVMREILSLMFRPADAGVVRYPFLFSHG